jgi:membrane dipeptidase
MSRKLASTRSHFTFDCHVDTLAALLSRMDGGLAADFVKGTDSLHLDLPRARAAGISGVFAAMCIENAFQYDSAPKRVLRMIRLAKRIADESEGAVVIARSTAELERAHSTGKFALVPAIENACSLAGSLDLLHIYYELGVRSLGLVWNGRNELGDGVRVRNAGGLTEFGVEVVRECNKIGMLVDVSHLSEKGFDDVADNCEGPFIATHSNARAICDHPRNLTDRQLKTIGGRGGVAGLNFCTAFLTEKAEDANLEHAVRHYLHMAEVAGSQSVALGSDFDGITDTPKGLESASKIPRLADALRNAGVSETDLRGFLGENILRVFKTVCG